MADFTPFARQLLLRSAKNSAGDAARVKKVQTALLRHLLSKGANTEIGRENLFSCLSKSPVVYKDFSGNVSCVAYEEIRERVLRMVDGEKDVLWPGKCTHFAQSSGTSGGSSKYIPITTDSLRHNHFKGASYTVAHYLANVPHSRIFSGKGLILGGSYASKLHSRNRNARIGDLSATLIDCTPWPANLFKTPEPAIALMPDWEEKLPLLAENVSRQNVTNISGVPSWMMTVLKKVLEIRGASNLHEVWPNLEVFFHGGISFKPYRHEYDKLVDTSRMHYLENYNASEGFFAVQDDLSNPVMLLLVDCGVFYEFIPFPGGGDFLPAWEVEEGKVYELVITAMNGLWRYRIGDTVKVESTSPLRISIAGRTKTFINAFGEELMEHNAEQALAETCRLLDCAVSNYTVAPVFAAEGHRGRHEWLIEWQRQPADIPAFALELDRQLQKVNSDYEAKRAHGIFLDPLTIVSIPKSTFDRWLMTFGNGRLGGQRKVPRLANDRRIADQVLTLVPYYS